MAVSDERPGCIKGGIRYFCGENSCPCPGYTDVARLQDSEVQLILKGLLRNLTEVRQQQLAEPEHLRTMRKQGTIEGLNIAIAAVRRRIR